ncbi:2-methoxy-6-polyprenyl-1,4-benzoquinol methylase, mitochondrial [Bombina bombina]|uniref:2-methoxy-6-polyprenyl-1,4-benzoquinol methylase, mitochondrial n=1 Tax=Bombina bombina TaxID=8345 RepID=UPI00235B2F3A|nr:2-methoxy-6-polyprenyl-1,4-benzoquinol methylase, mitochondrial [Bombina bombina]
MAAPMRAISRCCQVVSLWKWNNNAGGMIRRYIQTEASGKETHFGFQTVPEEEKGEKVYQVFESVAQKYDIMNDSMSLGVHRLWKDYLVKLMNPTPGTQLLDVAGGTGDVAFRFIDYIRAQKEKLIRQKLKSQQTLPWSEISRTYQQNGLGDLSGSQAVICDINKEMLKVGKQKALKLSYSDGLSWVAGDAEELPFVDEKFDVYTIAFGIRNVTHIEQALREAYRVLKPGGRFLCLEFSQVNNPLLARLYDLYSFQVIPVLGEVIAGDWKSYQYLVESIRRFPPQDEFKDMIEDAGFFKVNYHNLTSGVVAIHSGFKL